MNHRRGLLILAATAPLLFVGTAQAGATEVARLGSVAASPAVTGPVTGGNGAVVLQATSFNLSSVGYTQSEYFLTGNASSYVPAAPLGSDGAWQVTPASSAPYTTRIVVDRPANPARFNGSVIVEWLNVSAGLDTAPDWIIAHNELIRDGFAWVGVSAQAAGASATKATDPIRYAALSHPGDSYSYDIYSQAGQAIRDSAPTILSGLRPRAVLAEGESQSAFRLTTYIDAIQPLVHVYDGFLVHSRGAGGFLAPLSQAPQADVPTPEVVEFRSDLGVPVLTVETETDLLQLGYLPARQPDSAGLRLWEIAGTAHADDYIANLGAGDDGSGATALQALNRMVDPPNGTPAFSCAEPINTGQMHYVMDAAQYALNRWVTLGIPPAQAPRLQATAAGTAFVLDANGNALGGVRTPAVDAPVAALSGGGQTGTSSFCFLFGTTTPFDSAKLAALYPTHAQFVSRWAAATRRGAASGFITPADAAELVEAAATSGIGG